MRDIEYKDDIGSKPLQFIDRCANVFHCEGDVLVAVRAQIPVGYASVFRQWSSPGNLEQFDTQVSATKKGHFGWRTRMIISRLDLKAQHGSIPGDRVLQIGNTDTCVMVLQFKGMNGV